MERKVSELKPHPKSIEIYGNEELLQDFLDSIRAKGILVPLAIKEDGTIISGHRRWRAAQAVGIETVPVVIVSYADELDEREAIISFNKQREKTFSQKMAEAEELKRIEEERARLRIKKHGGTAPGRPANTPRNISLGDAGRTVDKVAQAVGLGSGRTFEKAVKVWEAAKKGDESAKKLVAELDAGKVSINAAYKQITQKEGRPKKEEGVEKKLEGMKLKKELVQTEQELVKQEEDDMQGSSALQQKQQAQDDVQSGISQKPGAPTMAKVVDIGFQKPSKAQYKMDEVMEDYGFVDRFWVTAHDFWAEAFNRGAEKIISNFIIGCTRFTRIEHAEHLAELLELIARVVREQLRIYREKESEKEA